MNTTSDTPLIRRGPAAWPLAALASLLALGACIQGPWDYYPENPAPFRGVFVTGYAIAKQPVRRVCFERLLGIREEATEAFPFYDSADVRVTGPFGGSIRTLVLVPQPDTQNCFMGDTTVLVENGGAYDLSARFVWDSAGQRVASVITGTAHVPTRFDIDSTATAPSIADTLFHKGGGGIPPKLFTRDSTLGIAVQIKAIADFVQKLPDDVRFVIGLKYGDTLVKLQTDTAAADAYLRKNGPTLRGMVIGLLQRSQVVYHDGDTLYYLNGDFNTLSHYYSSQRSGDVKAVLVTQRFDPRGDRPETSFDNPAGGPPPDSSTYYYPGDHRRLLIYPDARGRAGYNLLDSIGVVNVWFHTRWNTLFFYGVEQPYLAFHSTATQVQGGGGPTDGDPRVKVKYNVAGGQGIFVGAVVDSFHVFILADTLTRTYPLPITHAQACANDGWFHNPDCRGYYRPFCSERAWKGYGCEGDAVRACLEADLHGNDSLKAGCDSVARAQAGKPLEASAQLEFCVENGFPSSQPACAAPSAQCAESGLNKCKKTLWNYCKDNLWRPEAQCLPALVAYCKDNDRPSEVMCSRADAFCREHPDEAACK